MKKYRITFTRLLALALLASCGTSLAWTPIVNPTPKDRVVMLEDNRGSCTGVILQTNLVLTCAHCVEDSPLKLDGNPSVTLKIDRSKDLALLRVKTPVMERIRLSDCQIEDDVFTYGHPMGDKTLYYSKGYVMNVSDSEIKTSNISLPGDSGSPLFSKDGSLLGIISGGLGANGMDFPIATITPTKIIRQFLNW